MTDDFFSSINLAIAFYCLLSWYSIVLYSASPKSKTQFQNNSSSVIFIFLLTQKRELVSSPLTKHNAHTLNFSVVKYLEHLIQKLLMY